jgi:HlyD family secretion protein
MKRLVPIVAGLGVIALFLATLVFLWARAREPAEVFETDAPFRTDIIRKTVATGAIVPRNEVAIKARVSGVVDALGVEPGDEVKAGDLLARIKIIPNAATLNNAQSAVQSARIALDEATADLDRGRTLFDRAALSKAELDRLESVYKSRKEDHRSAVVNLQLVREGAASGSGQINTEVRSTVHGMVLDLPVESGASVIESNTFNEGTTIAVVADMSDMVFEGRVDESEVGRIEQGMPLDIVIGAIEDRRFAGTLEYISPKGALLDGAVQFEIRAALADTEGVFVRAGVSAMADIVLDRRTDVLAVREGVLRFEADDTYVEVEVGEQVFERRVIEVGLSDGIQIEVTGGLDGTERLKK